MSMMNAILGIGGAVINPLPGGTASSTQVGSSATAGWRFNANGTVDKRVQNSRTADHRWFDGTPSGSFWVRLTVVTGSSPTGASVGAWVGLSTAPEWSLVQPTLGVNSGTYTIEISSDASGSPIVSASAAGAYHIDAEFA